MQYKNTNPMSPRLGPLTDSVAQAPEEPIPISRNATAANAIDPMLFGPEHLVSVKQLSEWMGCSLKSVRHWLYRLKIKPANVPGRVKRFRAGDVQAAMRQSRVSGEAANAPA